MPPSFNGIHHLKLPCHSITATHDFYTRILPFEPQPQYDHLNVAGQLFAKIFLHKASNLLIEVRYHPAQATAQKGWDPITFGVSKRKDLDDWGSWFDTNGVKRSRVFMGLKSWILAAEDPDGKIVRLYVEDEEHEWTTKPDSDVFWLGGMDPDPNA
jgi:catechol-2,3-dioxygenase